MTTPSTKNQPRFFVSADWSKDPRKRSVYVADLKHRRIQSEARPDWGLDTLLALAERLCSQGSVLVGVDLALGVPRSYWELVLAEPRYGRPATFVNWLARLDSDSGFFDPANTVKDHEQWRVGRPWFHVPPGKGGLTSFTQKACDGFLRRIDRKTKAKPVFTVSGIPGTVGSGTRDFWARAGRLSEKEFRLLHLALRRFASQPPQHQRESCWRRPIRVSPTPRHWQTNCRRGDSPSARPSLINAIAPAICWGKPPG